ALPLQDRMLAADPRHVMGWFSRAAIRQYQGDFTGGRAAVTECLRLASSATRCMSMGIQIDNEIGECADAEALARRIITSEPEDDTGHTLLARALVAQGSDPALIQEALRQSWAREPQKTRRSLELEDTMHLAELRGDFAGARRLGGQLAVELEHVDDEPRHA